MRSRSRAWTRVVSTSASRPVEFACLVIAVAAVVASALPLSVWFAVGAVTAALLVGTYLLRRRSSRAYPLDPYALSLGLLAAAGSTGVVALAGADAPVVLPLTFLLAFMAGNIADEQGALAAAGVGAAALSWRVALAAPPGTASVAGIVFLFSVAAGWWARRRRLHPTQSTADPDAGLWRRTRSGAPPSSTAEQRMMRAAGRAVSGSVDRTLALLRSALRGQTAIALWLDSRTGVARIRSAETASDHLVAGPFSDRAGILGILRKRTEPFLLNRLRQTDGFLPWYEAGHEPAHVMGVGLYDEGILVGYLAVDRAPDQQPFDDVDSIALQAAADEVLGAVNTERLVVEACRSRHEMSVLYEAADAFNSALTPDDVCEIAHALVSRIAPVDVMVITSHDEDARTQSVFFARGFDDNDLSDVTFGDDASLAALALRRSHCLPYNGKLENPDTPIFGEDFTLPELQSIVIFPMTMGHRSIGTFTIGSFAPDAYEIEHRDQLRMIVNYAAAALSNALAYSSMVQRATTDGMTGLTNHRTFKERAGHALDRAERSGRPLSLIMTDIDHFKSVNDTYGHAVGDVVIKGVADVLHATLRKVDIGARYGGEEFAILLEDSDTDCAEALAERIRSTVEAIDFSDGKGSTLSVTMSFGVATYPYAPGTLADLIDTADQSLYTAKRGGRNQVVRFDAVAAAA